MTQIDLISNEWSDLLFENRNKEYGAYVLRHQTGIRNMLSILLVFVAAIVVVGVMAVRNKVVEGQSQVVVFHDDAHRLSDLKDKAPEVKRHEPVREENVEEVVQKVINSIKFTAPRIMEDDQVKPEDEMLTQEELMKSRVAIGVFNVIGNSDEGDVLRVRQMIVDEPVKPREQDRDKPFDIVEQMPQFPGGQQALMQYLGRNIRYPSLAEEMGIQGRVICTFVVERDGSVSDVRIARSVDPSLDKEALRVVGSMPKWIPGKQNGQTVRVKYTLPVTFRLQ